MITGMHTNLSVLKCYRQATGRNNIKFPGFTIIPSNFSVQTLGIHYLNPCYFYNLAGYCKTRLHFTKNKITV